MQGETEGSSKDINTIIENKSSQMTPEPVTDNIELTTYQEINPDLSTKEELSYSSSTPTITNNTETTSSESIAQETTSPFSSSSLTSTISSTLYPFVTDRVESTTTHVIEGFALHEYPKYYKKAQAFTVYGESCYDLCEKRGYSYTWCHKFKESSNGYWSKADVCTNDSTRTPYRENCIDDCAKRGNEYFWCHTGTLTWDYCTPESLLKYLDKRRNQ